MQLRFSDAVVAGAPASHRSDIAVPVPALYVTAPTVADSEPMPRLSALFLPSYTFTLVLD